MTEWKTKRVIGGYAIFTDKDVVVDLSEAEAKLKEQGERAVALIKTGLDEQLNLEAKLAAADICEKANKEHIAQLNAEKKELETDILEWIQRRDNGLNLLDKKDEDIAKLKAQLKDIEHKWNTLGKQYAKEMRKR